MTSRKNLVPFGSDKPNAKLNEKKVREARRLYSRGYSYGFLAERYNVSRPTIRKAVLGLKWVHV